MGILDLLSGVYSGIGNSIFGRSESKSLTEEIFSFKGIALAAVVGGTAVLIIKNI